MSTGPRDRPAAQPLTELIGVLSSQLRQPVAVDGWRPSVQGAVGHVVGVRSGGDAYVAKVFPPAASCRASTEVLALRLAGAVEGVPVPDVVLEGALPRGLGSFVLLTRLPGVRWADRRADLDSRQQEQLHRDVAQVLSRLHEVGGARFGGLLPDEQTWDDAWERVRSTARVHLVEFVLHGGRADVADRIDTLVLERKGLFGSDVRPVLCHHDLNDGNVLVSKVGTPRVTGVVDLERASWDDALADLALTCLHVRHHDADAVHAFLHAYGVRDGIHDQRLQVHLVLRALAERTWIAQDRPAGWTMSVAALDAFLVDLVR